MKARKGSKTRQLPSRGGLNDLAKTDRSILDYGKTTPIAPVQPASILNMARKGK